MPDLNSRIRKIIFYSVHILIQIYPFKLIIILFSTSPATVGGNISLTCSYTGDPTPTLAWVQEQRLIFTLPLLIYW